MSSDRGTPEESDSAVGGEESGGLHLPPRLVKVDRYGSVSGLVRVRVALGTLVIIPRNSEDPYGS